MTVPSTRMLRRGALGLALVFLPGLLAGETWDVDPVHSAIMFRSKRMGVGYVYGRFNEFSGTVEMNGAAIESGELDLEVKTASVDTGNQQRDAHLRSPDFLDAAKFPAMTFESTGVKPAGEGRYEVTGSLTLHGVTRPVSARVEHVGTGKAPQDGKTIMGFDGIFTLKRSEFEMTSLLGPASDEIDVHIALQLVAR